MFIRWQARRRRSPTHGPYRLLGDGTSVRADTEEFDVHWSAALSECVWINGRPRQRHLAYLGGITESAITHSAGARYLFWKKLVERLAEASVAGKDRRLIEDAVAARVPRLTEQERAKYKAVGEPRN